MCTRALGGRGSGAVREGSVQRSALSIGPAVAMSEVEQLSLRRFNALWKQYARRSRAPPQDRGVVAWFVRLLRHGQEGGDAARARSRRAREVEEYKQGGSRQLYEGQLSLEDAVLFVCDLRALLVRFTSSHSYCWQLPSCVS